MHDHNDYNDNDYCDLDPTKICDNCCKCIDSGRDYNELEVDFADAVYTADQLKDIAYMEDCCDEDCIDSSNVSPIEIDPKLMAEWERKLRVAEIAEEQQSVKGFHGERKRRGK